MGDDNVDILKHAPKNTRSKEQDEILREFNLILQAVYLTENGYQ